MSIYPRRRSPNQNTRLASQSKNNSQFEREPNRLDLWDKYKGYRKVGWSELGHKNSQNPFSGVSASHLVTQIVLLTIIVGAALCSHWNRHWTLNLPSLSAKFLLKPLSTDCLFYLYVILYRITSSQETHFTANEVHLLAFAHRIYWPYHVLYYSEAYGLIGLYNRPLKT